MGLFSFAAGLLGGGSKKKASKRAMEAQVAALNRAIDEQTRQFDLTRSDFQPFLNTGTAALGDLGDLVGINGADEQGSAIEALRGTPFYQSLFNNGEEAVLQNAAATGEIRGGDTKRALADFGADTLMQTIQQQLASLGGLANMGMGATNAVGNFGANKANNVSNFLVQQGQARAGDFLTRGGINAANWQNAGSFLDNAVTAFLPGGGGLKSIF